MTQLGFRPGARYRIVPEARLLEIVLLAGWAYEVRGPERGDAYRAAAEAIERWVRAGLPFERTKQGERSFDAAEALNFAKSPAFRNADPFFYERFVPTARRMAGEFHPGLRDGQIPSRLKAPRRFEVVLRREFGLTGLTTGARARFRLPLPLEDSALRDLGVTFEPPACIDAASTIALGHLDAVLHVPDAPVLSLEARLTFTALPAAAGPQTETLDDAQRELYTRHSEGFVRVTPRVRALADELAAESSDALATLRAFWEYVCGIPIGMLHYDQFSEGDANDMLLDDGWVDCRMGSTLLVSLCRARGIPARLCNGYLLYAASPTYHSWAEIWIDGRGWIPADLFTHDVSAGGNDEPWRDYFFGYLDYRMKRNRSRVCLRDCRRSISRRRGGSKQRRRPAERTPRSSTSTTAR